MGNKHAAIPGDRDSADHWPAIVASLAVSTGFLALWFWLLPPWLGFTVTTSGSFWWRCLAAVPAIAGFSVAFRCIWDFGRTGHGTPAPIAPPKELVTVGFYRHVRNPMYLGFLVGWAGLWVVFGKAGPAAILLACVAVLGVALFVMAYEEPTLRQTFGEEYEDYCRKVPRWIPRPRRETLAGGRKG